MNTLMYERFDSKTLCAAIRLRTGERLLALHPFGWHIDGVHIPNAPEQFSREGVCEEHGWVIVDELGPYVAIVRTPPVDDSAEIMSSERSTSDRPRDEASSSSESSHRAAAVARSAPEETP